MKNGFDENDLEKIRLEARESYKTYLYARFQNGVRDGEATMTEAEYIEFYIEYARREMMQSEDVLPPITVSNDTKNEEKVVMTEPIVSAPPARPQSDKKKSFFGGLFSGKGKKSDKTPTKEERDILPTAVSAERQKEQPKEEQTPTDPTGDRKTQALPNKKRKKPALRKNFLVVLICYLIIMGLFASIIFINTVNVDEKDAGAVSAEAPSGEGTVIQIMPQEDGESQSETLFDKICDMLQ